MATGTNNLAALYFIQKRFEDAEPLFKRSLEIREKILEPGHPEIIQSLVNFSAVLRKTGRTSDAKKMEARVRELRRKKK